ncbi:MBOAT family O-acyltransferase [Treponema pedis]|uniref:Alginate O-acetylation protein n=2 Tax=Treponema pedis TaxID=409322 RepID=S6A4K5_9SPIR|nr:MBOAT family O-acyltransferase [Treponema pedis]AGT44511.1 alginate O-acetylation protein [Treponema pedis str. T A4]
MFFPTFQFAVFFLITFFLYWYIFRQERQRKILLVFASYIFYSFWDWRFCILLFSVTAINYFYGFLLEKEKNYNPRKFIFIIITVLNILYLCFFKYLYGILEVFNKYFPDMYGASPFLTQIKIYSCLLPVGISYYTFRCMSYIFDIYLCKIRHTKSFWDILLYVSFFPQISLGPIVQAEYFLKNLPKALNCDEEKKAKPIELDRAVLLFLSGLYKKIIIANFLTVLVTDKIFANPQFYNTAELIFGILCTAIIIYADFSGYSDMAVSVGLFFGFNTPDNFNRPYLSKSVTEFWRRWHISFSSWLRDYLYFALGGSRFGLPRTLFALFFTMVIAGLWHGGKLTFIIWGCLQGLMLVIERLFDTIKKNGEIEKDFNTIPIENMGNKNKFVNAVKIFFVFVFINISWLIFFSGSLSEFNLYLNSLKNFFKPFQIINPFILTVFFAGLTMQLPSKNLRKKVFEIYIRVPLVFKAVFSAAVIALIFTLSTSGVPQFIYFGF